MLSGPHGFAFFWSQERCVEFCPPATLWVPKRDFPGSIADRTLGSPDEANLLFAGITCSTWEGACSTVIAQSIWAHGAESPWRILWPVDIQAQWSPTLCKQPGGMLQMDWHVSTAYVILNVMEDSLFWVFVFQWKSPLVNFPFWSTQKLWGFLLLCFVLFWRYNEVFTLEACSKPVMLWLMSLYNSDKLKPSQGAHSSWISL